MKKRYKRLIYTFEHSVEIYEYLDGKYGAMITDSDDAEKTWEEVYGEEFPKKEEIAPVQPKKRKESKVVKAKKPERKPIKTERSETKPADSETKQPDSPIKSEELPTENEEKATKTPDTTTISAEPEEKEPEKTTVYYVTDEVQQSQYINMFKAQGQDAIVLTHNIDSAFVTYLEQKHEDVRFLRIDADVHESLKDEVAEDEKESFGKMADSLVEIFRKELNDDKLDVKVEKLKDDKVASMAVLSEENRRMEEMMKMYGMSGMDSAMFGSKATLVLNANHPLVKFLTENKESENVTVICKQLYDLAMLAHKPLSPEEMTAFVQRSNEIMLLLTK